MEASLIDAIIQLQQIATPPPTTMTTELQIFQTKDEHAFLHAFVNKMLNKQAEEREERPSASGLTKQQEQNDIPTPFFNFNTFRFFNFLLHSIFTHVSQSTRLRAPITNSRASKVVVPHTNTMSIILSDGDAKVFPIFFMQLNFKCFYSTLVELLAYLTKTPRKIGRDIRMIFQEKAQT